MLMPVWRMLVLSNYDTGKCRYQKISALEIPILNMAVPGTETTDNGSTRKRGSFSVAIKKSLFFSCWGPYLTPDNIQHKSNPSQKADLHEKEK